MDRFFVYYSCDEWKMWDSMRLIGVFDEETLKQVIIRDLHKKDIELDDRDDDEIMNMDIQTINSLIKYGHIEEVHLNERR